MKKWMKHGVISLVGAGYAALAICFSRWLVRHLSDIWRALGGLFGVKGDTLSYVEKVLAQLKDASLHSPWLAGLLIGAGIGLLLIPLGLIALWFTDVNTIRFGSFVSVFLPLVPHL